MPHDLDPTRAGRARGAALVAAAALLLACDDTVPAKATASTSSGASMHATTSSAGAGGDGGPSVDRGPTVVMLATNPNGLFWNAATQTLLIADDDGNRVLTWTDAGGLGAEIDLAGTDDVGLGQVVQMDDGTVLVARFGYGSAGDIAVVKPDGTKTAIPNLDKTRRRIGLGLAPDGSIYDTYFLAVPTGYAGAVAKVTLAGTETDVVETLGKPIGVIVVGSTLFFSDQAANAVYDAPVANPKNPAELAAVDDPDLMCAGPNGSVFTGGGTAPREIASDGTFTVVGSGFVDVRGVAYDPDHKRLFVADHGDMAFGIVPTD